MVIHGRGMVHRAPTGYKKQETPREKIDPGGLNDLILYHLLNKKQFCFKGFIIFSNNTIKPETYGEDR